MLTQYASIMSSFYFFLIIIKSDGYQSNIEQKFNEILHMCFFIFSTLTPFFAMIFMEKKTKKIKKENTFQKLQTFYDCGCNSFIPFVSLLGNLSLFLAFNLVFYLFSTYLAFHAKSFKINRIILSSYLIFFHVGFIILSILNKQKNQQFYEMTIFLVKIILFLGALHEVLTLICGVIYDIYTEIRNILSKILIVDKFKYKKYVLFKYGQYNKKQITNNRQKMNRKNTNKIQKQFCHQKSIHQNIQNFKTCFKIQNNKKKQQNYAQIKILIFLNQLSFENKQQCSQKQKNNLISQIKSKVRFCFSKENCKKIRNIINCAEKEKYFNKKILIN